MDLILLDKLCFNTCLEKVKPIFDEKKFKIDNISSLSYKNEKFDEVFCIFAVTYNFLEADALNFLKNQKMYDDLHIFLVFGDKLNDFSEKYIAENWIDLIGKKLNKNYFTELSINRNLVWNLTQFFAKRKYVIRDKNLTKVEIYTDGACSGNPGNGGWSALIRFEGEKSFHEYSGGERDTTNNRMEILAVIKALEELPDMSFELAIHSDSAYVVNTFEQQWFDKWRKQNWKNSEKKPVKNLDLWKRLDSLLQKHKYNFIKVQGHSDNELNNRCDELAVAETTKLNNEDKK